MNHSHSQTKDSYCLPYLKQYAITLYQLRESPAVNLGSEIPQLRWHDQIIVMIYDVALRD